MAGTQPQLPRPDATPDGVGDTSRWWWWLVVVGVVAIVVLLVVQPWVEYETEPTATDSAASASDVPGGTTPSLKPSTTSPVPGTDARFGRSTMGLLFVTPQDLAADVPAAVDGVRAGIAAGDLPWGLPDGSSVLPASCTTAVTVVPRRPVRFDARSYLNDQLSWEQHVTVLANARAARGAFAELVTTVDACPSYTQLNRGSGASAWRAEPALEGLGAYPSIVQVVTQSEGGVSSPEYRGHMLVGNTILTWTATSLATDVDQDAALATLGDPTSLNAMVQGRAQLAVEKVG